jgi:hypothetical protein
MDGTVVEDCVIIPAERSNFCNNKLLQFLLPPRDETITEETQVTNCSFL